MTEIQFVDETGAIMFLNDNKELIENIFINKYSYDLINDKQKEALKKALLRQDATFQELWLLEDHTLYLTYVSKHNQSLVDIITNDGLTKTRLQQEVLDVLDYEFNIIHDWEEKQ